MIVNFILNYFTKFSLNKHIWGKLIPSIIQVQMRKFIYNYFNDYFFSIKKRFFDSLEQNYIFILDNFLADLRKGNLIFTLENLIKEVYPILRPSSLNFLAIILVNFNLHYSESFIHGELFHISLETQTYLGNIFNAYIAFILILNLSYYIIIKNNMKVNNPLLYQVFLFLSVIILVLLIITFFYYIEKLILSIIKRFVDWFMDEYIIKMMASSAGGSNPQPGGFGEPAGGGGRPPKKPGGPTPPKGHYVDEDSDTDYASYFGDTSDDSNENEDGQNTEEPKRKFKEKTWWPDMNDEERADYNAYNNYRKKQRKLKEAPEDKHRRLERDNIRRMLNWYFTSPEERRRKLDKRNNSIALTNAINEELNTPEENEAQKTLTRAKVAERKKKWKANETEDKKRRRLDKNRAKINSRLQNETEADRRARLDRKNELARLRRLKKKEDKNKDKDKK